MAGMGLVYSCGEMVGGGSRSIEQNLQLLLASFLGILRSLEIQDTLFQIHFADFTTILLADTCDDLHGLHFAQFVHSCFFGFPVYHSPRPALFLPPGYFAKWSAFPGSIPDHQVPFFRLQ